MQDDNSQHDLFAPILNNDALMGPFLLTARLFMSGIFVFYLLHVFDIFREERLPSVLLYLGMGAICAGVVLLVLGYKTRFAAILMAVYLNVLMIFLPHVLGILFKVPAVTGGFFFMFAYGAGPLSLDRYLGTSKPRIVDNKAFMGPLLLIGRILVTFVFLYMGLHKIGYTSFTQAYMSLHHVPPNLVYLAMFTQTVFPILVLLGYNTRYGALGLAGFCMIASSLFHNQFSIPFEVGQFGLDWAIAGGFLFMFAYGPGPLSVEEWQRRAKPTAARSEAPSMGA